MKQIHIFKQINVKYMNKIKAMIKVYIWLTTFFFKISPINCFSAVKYSIGRQLLHESEMKHFITQHICEWHLCAISVHHQDITSIYHKIVQRKAIVPRESISGRCRIVRLKDSWPGAVPGTHHRNACGWAGPNPRTLGRLRIVRSRFRNLVDIGT